MGLFGFGKKKEPTKTSESVKEFLRLDRRSALRYNVQGLPTSLGEAIEAARNSVVVAVGQGRFSVGDFVDITIDGIEFEAEAARVMPGKVAFRLMSPLPVEVIEKYRKRLEEYTFSTCDVAAEDELIHSDEELEVNRAIINLMLELDDPNTNIEKFTQNIDALPKLKEMILTRANSVERARGAKVESVSAAITRLGFEEIKRIVYEFINYEINLTTKTLPAFKDFEVFHIFLNAIFKKLAAITSFKDIKSEGQSLLSMCNVGAVLMSKRDEKLASFYRSPKELFGYEMRLLERKELCSDLIDMDRRYFVDTLGVFKHLYDGFALANLLLYPYYALGFSVMSGERKFRYAYLVYLSVLAVRFVLAHDKYAGYVLFNRLKKFGYGMNETKAMLDELIARINKKLAKLNIEKRIEHSDIPSALYSLGNFLGSGIYFDYFKAKLHQLDSETDRLAIRYEDEHYTHFVLEKILNSDDFSFRTLPFVVIPCEASADEDITLEQFRTFDLIVFRNVHKLPKALWRDFQKIWRDFEGKIILTFDTSSMLDLDMRQGDLFAIFKESVVDFPSYFHSAVLYQKMVLNSINLINRFVEAQVCDVALFKEGTYSQKGVLGRCIEKV